MCFYICFTVEAYLSLVWTEVAAPQHDVMSRYVQLQYLCHALVSAAIDSMMY